MATSFTFRENRSYTYGTAGNTSVSTKSYLFSSYKPNSTAANSSYYDLNLKSTNRTLYIRTGTGVEDTLSFGLCTDTSATTYSPKLDGRDKKIYHIATKISVKGDKDFITPLLATTNFNYSLGDETITNRKYVSGFEIISQSKREFIRRDFKFTDSRPGYQVGSFFYCNFIPGFATNFNSANGKNIDLDTVYNDSYTFFARSNLPTLYFQNAARGLYYWIADHGSNISNFTNNPNATVTNLLTFLHSQVDYIYTYEDATINYFPICKEHSTAVYASNAQYTSDSTNTYETVKGIQYYNDTPSIIGINSTKFGYSYGKRTNSIEVSNQYSTKTYLGVETYRTSYKNGQYNGRYRYVIISKTFNYTYSSTHYSTVDTVTTSIDYQDEICRTVIPYEFEFTAPMALGILEGQTTSLKYLFSDLNAYSKLNNILTTTFYKTTLYSTLYTNFRLSAYARGQYFNYTTSGTDNNRWVMYRTSRSYKTTLTTAGWKVVTLTEYGSTGSWKLTSSTPRYTDQNSQYSSSSLNTARYLDLRKNSTGYNSYIASYKEYISKLYNVQGGWSDSDMSTISTRITNGKKYVFDTEYKVRPNHDTYYALFGAYDIENNFGTVTETFSYPIRTFVNVTLNNANA